MFKRKMFLIGGICAVLLISVVVIGNATARAVDSANLRDLSTVNGEQQAAANISVPTVGSLEHVEAKDGQETIRLDIQALVTQWSETMLKGEGWLHVVAHHTRDKEESSPLPNGQTIPLNYISETWYHLSDQGQAVEVIAFMRSEDGDPVQISTFRDNMWRNLTVGEKWAGAPYTPRLDLGFSTLAGRAHEWDCTLSQQTTTSAGKPVLQFTLREEFDSPLQMEGYAQPAVAAERRASFDVHSGALLLLERILVTVEGEEHIVERVGPITSEYGVVPPAEVLALLQQEVTE